MPSSGFYGAGEDTEANAPTIWLDATRSKLSVPPPPSSPPFYTGCPSCHISLNLCWLGTGTTYAGLHTQWLGSSNLHTQKLDAYMLTSITTEKHINN